MKNENLGTEANTLDDSHGFLAKLSDDFFATHRVIVRTHGLLLIVSIHADYCKTSEKKALVDVSVSPSLARSKIKNVAR